MQKEDLISRRAAIKAIEAHLRTYTEPYVLSEREDAINYGLNVAADVVENLPPAQPGCEDAVSRDALDILIEEAQTAWLKGDILLMYPALKKGLKKIPPVTPKQPGWTYIEEALPKTIINEHTHDYQEYNCLCDFGDYGFDVRTYKFGDGHFWNGGGIVDKYVTAWQPLPEIPDALKP